MKLQVLYNDRSIEQQYRQAHGFAVLISPDSDERTILFDTGEKPEILLYNMKKMKIDPEDKDIIVISHEHQDHYGALEELIRINDNIALYVPRSMSSRFINYYRSLCSMMMAVSKPTQIIDGVFCSGDCAEGVNEQFLVLQSKNGLIIVTGCAHFGMNSLFEGVQTISKDPIHMLFGGFHLADADNKILEAVKLIKQYNIKTIAAGHCTPPRAINIFKHAFGNSFIEIGVGKTLEV